MANMSVISYFSTLIKLIIGYACTFHYCIDAVKGFFELTLRQFDFILSVVDKINTSYYDFWYKLRKQ